MDALASLLAFFCSGPFATFHTQFKIPKNITHELPHNHSKILNTFILSLVLVPTKTHATTMDLFLTFLPQQKFTRQVSSDPVVLNKFYFYLFTISKIKIQPHFSVL
jgi:hypothetical protein